MREEDAVMSSTFALHRTRTRAAVSSSAVLFRVRVRAGERGTVGRRKEDPGNLVCETAMTRVEQLEQEIAKLNPEEFVKLRDWLLEQDWAEWDREIERDAASGKLDGLMKQARADHAAGKSRPL